MNVKNIFKDDEGRYVKVFTVTEEKQELMSEEEIIKAKDKFKELMNVREEKEELFSQIEKELIEIDQNLELLNVFQAEEEQVEE